MLFSNTLNENIYSVFPNYFNSLDLFIHFQNKVQFHTQILHCHSQSLKGNVHHKVKLQMFNMNTFH